MLGELGPGSSGQGPPSSELDLPPSLPHPLPPGHLDLVPLLLGPAPGSRPPGRARPPPLGPPPPPGGTEDTNVNTTPEPPRRTPEGIASQHGYRYHDNNKSQVGLQGRRRQPHLEAEDTDAPPVKNRFVPPPTPCSLLGWSWMLEELEADLGGDMKGATHAGYGGRSVTRARPRARRASISGWRASTSGRCGGATTTRGGSRRTTSR